MINFKSIPFLRILFPFVVGTITCMQLGQFKNQHLAFLVSLVCLIITFLFQYFYRPVSSIKKPLYIICLNVFFVLLAFEAVFVYQAKNDPEHYSHLVTRDTQDLVGIIEDVPVATEKFVKLSLQLNSIKVNDTWHHVNGKTIVYLKNDHSKNLSIGNTVFIRSKFSYVNAPQNPGEFDYKTFLEERNIFHVVYAKPNELYIMPETKHSLALTRLGAGIKAKVVSVLRENGLSQEAFSICSALLVGYDDEIDSSVMQSFSHSGTLHILSVSGMHTGVLYGILIWLFAKADKYDRRKKLKCFFVIASLFVFVLITGFSPSVLRAALMLSLVMIGKTFYKEGNSYNTLLLSAFLLLVYDPFLIKDVGFLLSYFAVFGIMYFYPTLSKIYTFENKWLQALWTSALLSTAATVFTLPVSLYFFHQFPLWFILSNVVIIPISIGLMIAAIAMLCLYKIAFVKMALAYLINGGTAIMLWLAQLTDKPGLGYIDFISFSKTDAFFCSLLIFLFLVIIVSKQYKQVMYFGTVCIMWLCASVYANYKESTENELVVFHVKHKTVFAIRAGHNVFADFRAINDKEFQRYVKPYLLRFSGLKIMPVESNIIRNSHSTILLANKGLITDSLANASHFIVSNDTPLEIPANTVKNTTIVIADCSNSYKFVQDLKQQCEERHIVFYSVKESGAVQLNLD